MTAAPRIERAQIINALVEHARPLILTRYRPDSCIDSTRIGIAALAHFGITGRAEVMQCIVATRALFERLEAGTFDGNFRPGEHSVGIGFGVATGRAGPPDSFDGHVVIVVPGAPDVLIDLSIDNTHRPEKGIHIGPLAMPLSADWREGGRAVKIAGETRVIYCLMRNPPSYHASPGWRGHGKIVRLLVRQIVARMKEELYQ